MKYLMIVPAVLATLLVGGLATPAQADGCDKLTYLTFSAPVELPGVTLPAGTYRFTHPDDCSSSVLRVSSRDGRKLYGTFLTIPDERLTPTNQPEVVLAEMPKGSPDAIKDWFYPGDDTGDALIYPKKEAPKVAEAPTEGIVATNGLV